MAWGSGGLKSCSALWERVERNELEELYVLPTKTVNEKDWARCADILLKHGSKRKIHTMNASGHPITPDALRKIARAIAKTSSEAPWKHLAIGDGQLGDEGVDALIAAWENEEVHLESLDLSFKGLTAKSVERIFAWASSSKHLKHLDLSRNIFDDMTETTEPMVKVETSHLWPSLEILNLSDCGINGNQCQPLLSHLQSMTSLRILHISSNPLGTSSMVLASLPSNIAELHVASCKLEGPDLDTVSRLKGLKILDVSSNDIKGGPWIQEGLANHLQQLETMNLSGNRGLGVDGATEIIRTGLAHRSVVELDLSQTNCGVEGAAVAIQESGATSLRFFDNSLGSDGLVALAKCFLDKELKGLKTLDVAGNRADQIAVVAFLRPLLQVECATSLETVVVGGNQGGPELEVLVKEILQVRPNLDIARDKLKKKEGEPTPSC